MTLMLAGRLKVMISYAKIKGHPLVFDTPGWQVAIRAASALRMGGLNVGWSRALPNGVWLMRADDNWTANVFHQSGNWWVRPPEMEVINADDAE